MDTFSTAEWDQLLTLNPISDEALIKKAAEEEVYYDILQSNITLSPESRNFWRQKITHLPKEKPFAELIQATFEPDEEAKKIYERLATSSSDHTRASRAWAIYQHIILLLQDSQPHDKTFKAYLQFLKRDLQQYNSATAAYILALLYLNYFSAFNISKETGHNYACHYLEKAMEQRYQPAYPLFYKCHKTDRKRSWFGFKYEDAFTYPLEELCDKEVPQKSPHTSILAAILDNKIIKKKAPMPYDFNEVSLKIQIIQYYKNAIEAGFYAYGYKLGEFIRYLSGTVLSGDMKQFRIQAYTMGAEYGCSKAQVALSILYSSLMEEGRDPQVCTDALCYARKAIANKNSMGHIALGLFYENKPLRTLLPFPEERKQNLEQAEKAYRQAIEESNLNGYYHLGFLYYENYKSFLDINEGQAHIQAVKFFRQSDRYPSILHDLWDPSAKAYNLITQQTLAYQTRQLYQSIEKYLSRAAQDEIDKKIKSINIPSNVRDALMISDDLRTLEEREASLVTTLDTYSNLVLYIGPRRDVNNLWSKTLYDMAILLINRSSQNINPSQDNKQDIESAEKDLRLANRCLKEVSPNTSHYFQAKFVYMQNLYNAYYSQAQLSQQDNPVKDAWDKLLCLFQEFQRNAAQYPCTYNAINCNERDEQFAAWGIQDFMERIESKIAARETEMQTANEELLIPHNPSFLSWLTGGWIG